MPSLPDRFWRRVVREGDCLIWTGYTDKFGYGWFNTTNQGRKSTHKYVYEEAKGPVPEGLELDHTCRRHACVNVEHLEPVTHAENVRRGLHGVLRTHCKNGHELTPENTIVNSKGWRDCRECHREEYRRRKDAKRAP